MLRIIGFIFVIWLVIYIIGRIGSRSGKSKQEQKKEPEMNDQRSGFSKWFNSDDSHSNPESEKHWEDDWKKNVQDGKYREIDPEESEPEKQSSDPLQDSIKHISSLANEIRDQSIREKAFRVLILAENIIHEHEDEETACRNYSQFESYYIPTLESVLDNYHKMENKGLASAKIREDVMAYLNGCEEAFNTLYKSMFSDDLMNMEVQMKAMNITLKRDGLL